MPRIPGIPADTDLNVANNATTWASKVTSWLHTIAAAFGDAAFRNVGTSSTAASNTLLERSAFGSGAFLSTGSQSTNLALRSDIPTGTATTKDFGTADEELPTNAQVATKITAEFNKTVNKVHFPFFVDSSGTVIGTTAVAEGSAVSIDFDSNAGGDLDDVNFATITFSASTGIWSESILSTLFSTTSILYFPVPHTANHQIACVKDTAGDTLKFWHVNASATNVKIHLIAGEKWRT